MFQEEGRLSRELWNKEKEYDNEVIAGISLSLLLQYSLPVVVYKTLSMHTETPQTTFRCQNLEDPLPGAPGAWYRERGQEGALHYKT